MAADDVARALLAMDDDTVRRAVAAGDFTGIDANTLDEGELGLLQAAAAEDAEVSGFIICDRFITCNGIAGLGAFGVALNFSKGSKVPGFATFYQAKLAQGSTW